METLTAIAIHKVLHNPAFSVGDKVLINNTEKRILKAPNGCRYIDEEHIRFMVQNQNKNSSYAMLARQGWKITWGIKKVGTWSCIAQDPKGNFKSVKL